MPAETMNPEAPLSFRVDVKDSATVVHCSGRLMAGATEAFRAEVKGLFPQTNRIVLDLTNLTRMDSMGLGAIVSLYVSAKTAGCGQGAIRWGPRGEAVRRLRRPSIRWRWSGRYWQWACATHSRSPPDAVLSGIKPRGRKGVRR